MLSVCASSTEQQLATMAGLLRVLGATASSCGMDDSLTAATAWAERYVLNGPGELRRQVYAESLAGYGGQRLMVSRTPLWAIQRLFDDTATCEATEYCSTDFRIEDADAGFVTLTSDAGFAWTPPWDLGLSDYPRPSAIKRPWLIVYEAGWQLAENSSTCKPSTSTGRTLPEDVERAVLLKAAELYQGTSGLESMAVGPLRLNYRSEGVDEVIGLLAPYRRSA